MARPLRNTNPGAFDLITSRGNERKASFKSRAGRQKFLACLESAAESYSVDLVSKNPKMPHLSR